MTVVLASASPRRRVLLAQAGIAFEVKPADIPEEPQPGEGPEAHVRRLAREKANTIAREYPTRLVLGADTVVALGNDILGKPTSPADAKRMLRRLAGTVHEVFTGVCLRRLDPPRDECWAARTRVWFKPLDDAAIERYCALVHTLDKAGAYAIQEHGELLVERIDGHKSTVVGLPIEDVLERLGAPAPSGIRIDAERCTGCGLCVKACAFGAIRMVERTAVIDYDACTVCGACASICRRAGAIVAEPGATAADAEPTRRGTGELWVLCDGTAAGTPAPVTLELLGLARELAAQLGVRVGAVNLGTLAETAAPTLIAHGADTVYWVAESALAQHDDARLAAVLARLAREHVPQIVLGGATVRGRAILPRVAVLLHTGLTADCTELDIDPASGLLRQTRPAFGGNIMASILCERHRPQMATVRPGVLPQPVPDPVRCGRVVRCAVRRGECGSRLQRLAFQPRAADDLELREARVVVAAGRGVGGPDGVRLVARLAQALGGALGASRAVVDTGWLDYAHQVGQTGTTVQPELYVACGVSGATQHIVGMRGSATIVAINRDAHAPIFAHADIAIVGDIAEIIPEWLRQLANSPSAAR